MKQHLGIFARGLAMGAADLVPGVSGGTVALITGIYDELLKAISSFDLGLVSTWKAGGFRAVWRHINGSFLTALAMGIGTSIIALSGLLHYLLEHERHRTVQFLLRVGGHVCPAHR
jgi:putative membrane protein